MKRFFIRDFKENDGKGGRGGNILFMFVVFLHDKEGPFDVRAKSWEIYEI